MKKSIIYISAFFAVLLWFSSTANAQSLKAGEYTVSGVQYRVDESKKYLFFGVERKNHTSLPKNKETINGVASYYVNTTPTNEGVWRQQVVNILGNLRVAALKQNKENLDIRFYVKPNGEIYYMYLSVRHHSTFTLQEIAKIEQELLKKHKMALKSDNNEHL